MNTISVVLVICACLFAHGTESMGWEGTVAHKSSQKELRSGVRISLKKSKDSQVYLQVENRTGIDLCYYGYAKNSPQRFLKEKRDGEWVATTWDWCGVGMKRHLLKKEKNATFRINGYNRPVQVFAIFYNAKDRLEFGVIKLFESE